MDAAVSKVLIVRSGSEHYALDMMTVQEVVYHPELTILPQINGFITGMCRWRDKQIPVVDLGLFLGKSIPARSGDIVITVTSGNAAGLLVEEIGPIVEIPGSAYIPVDKNLAQEQEKIFQAFEYQEELVFIIESKAMIKHFS